MHKHNILVRPIFTEKGALSKEQNKYVFQVNKDASKIEIKKAIKDLFNVDAISVNTANYQGKKKRVGRFVGKRADWKKAVATLSEGSSINLVEEA
ncbi:MAG: 50S ribosomal protein L23 [bacterium]|nr:50S ribosomal protein L23 [bacterium]